MEHWIIFVAVTIFIDVIVIHFAYEKGCKDRTEEYKSKFREIASDLGLDSDGDIFGAVNWVNNQSYMIWIYINAETGNIQRSVINNKSPIEKFNSIFY